MRGMRVGTRAHSVNFEERTPIAHLAQAHFMNLNAGGSQNFKRRTNCGIDAANNHDQTRPRTGRGRH